MFKVLESKQRQLGTIVEKIKTEKNKKFMCAPYILQLVSQNKQYLSVIWLSLNFLIINSPNIPLATTVAVAVKLSPGYSVLYQIPEGDTSKTTIYDREISYGHTVKPP